MLRDSGLNDEQLTDLLDDYPLKPHELLRDRTYRVFEHLETLCKFAPNRSVWLLSPTDKLVVLTLNNLVAALSICAVDALLVTLKGTPRAFARTPDPALDPRA